MLWHSFICLQLILQTQWHRCSQRRFAKVNERNSPEDRDNDSCLPLIDHFQGSWKNHFISNNLSMILEEDPTIEQAVFHITDELLNEQTFNICLETFTLYHYYVHTKFPCKYLLLKLHHLTTMWLFHTVRLLSQFPVCFLTRLRKVPSSFTLMTPLQMLSTLRFHLKAVSAK